LDGDLSLEFIIKIDGSGKNQNLYDKSDAAILTYIPYF
jgi:hypothetical protein